MATEPPVVPTAAPSITPTTATEPPVVPTLSPSDGMMSMSMDMEFHLDDVMDDEFGRVAGKKSKKTYVSDKVSVSTVCFIKFALQLGQFPHFSLFLICPSATR
jgi:hypothetical protein